MRIKWTNKTSKGKARAKLAIEWTQLRRRVFMGTAGNADERFFKMAITTWITGPRKQTWQQLLFDVIAQRNKDPQRLKYCYYSRAHQRALPTTDFEAWASGIRKELEKILIQIHG